MGERTLKVLIIQLRQLGDILLTTPVIRAIKNKYPHAEISFLSHPMGKLILTGNKDLNEHLIYPTEGKWQQLQFMLSLRAKKFDLVFDFMGNPRSALLTRVTGAPQRYSFASPRSWAYTGVVPRESGFDYIVREKFRILAQAGITDNDVRLVLPWDESHLKPWSEFLSTTPQLNESNAPRVVLSPTHRRLNRRWSNDLWIQLADHLAREWQASVIWLWGPGEKEEVMQLQNACKETTFLAPSTSFRELAALVAQCELFIGNSNGPSHVAVAVNTPSLQLHGPTDAPSWSPSTMRHQTLAKSSMAEISLDDVLAKLQGMQSLVTRERNLRGTIKSSDHVVIQRPSISE